MSKKWHLSEQDKAHCIALLSKHLTALRAEAGISQGDLAQMVGISRQTYAAAEGGTRRLSWETFLALLCFFDSNRNTHDTLHRIGAYPSLLRERFQNNAQEIDVQRMISALDEQARHTLRTVLLVEYARCTQTPVAQLLETLPAEE